MQSERTMVGFRGSGDHAQLVVEEAVVITVKFAFDARVMSWIVSNFRFTALRPGNSTPPSTNEP
jgi:hypothetical protein